MIITMYLILIKFTIAISALVVFYKLFLKRLTFFQLLRHYFLVGIGTAFVVSMVTIDFNNYQLPVSYPTEIIRNIPAVQHITNDEIGISTNSPFDFRKLLLVVWLVGLTFFALRIVIQIFSFFYLQRTAKKIKQGPPTIFLIENTSAPFSFGNSIFVSPANMESEDIDKILAHENIHIKQKHSIDIIIAELVCIFNWFNPFVWVLKRSLRENLEYLTDDAMIKKGVDEKAYQYLLLKSSGNQSYSFSSSLNSQFLKSRIIMINRIKSQPRQKLMFVFFLPILTAMIVSFRNVPNELVNNFSSQMPLFNNNHIQEMLEKNSTTANSDTTITVDHIEIHGETGKGDTAIVYFKNGSTERYILNNAAENKIFKQKYEGLMPNPPEPIKVQENEIPEEVEPLEYEPIHPIPDNISEITFGSENIWLKLEDGTEEHYDLTNKDQKKSFEMKFGKLKTKKSI